MFLYIYLGWSYPWSLKVLSDGATVNAETNELIKVLRICQEPNWPYFMFRIHFKDRLRFWLLLSYRPWRDQVVNGHCALPEEENTLQSPEIHLGRMPGLRGKSHLLTSSPACISSLRKYSLGGLEQLVLALSFASPVSVSLPFSPRVPRWNPWRPGQE